MIFSEHAVLPPRYEARNHIEIADDPFWIPVTQINLAIRSPDVDYLVTPHIGACRSNTANSISPNPAPWFNRVTQDSLLGNPAQAESQSSYFDPKRKKPISKTTPRHGECAQADDANYAQHEPRRARWTQGDRQDRAEDHGQNDHTPQPAGMCFLSQGMSGYDVRRHTHLCLLALKYL